MHAERESDGHWYPPSGECRLSCLKRQSCNFGDTEANRMPYVYWLPESEAAHAWVLKILRLYFNPPPVSQKDLERAGQQQFKFEI